MIIFTSQISQNLAHPPNLLLQLFHLNPILLPLPIMLLPALFLCHAHLHKQFLHKQLRIIPNFIIRQQFLEFIDVIVQQIWA